MGRPINKRFFGDTGDAGNQIIITGDIGGGIFTGFIVRQKSTREFIANLNGVEGRVRLVDNITPGVGEAYIELFEDGSDADGSGADYTADMALTTVAVAALGSGHSVADTLTLAGGAATTPATLNIVSVIPLNGQDEGDYVARFTPGTGYTNGTPTTDVITLSDGTVLTTVTVAGGVVTAFTIDSTTATAGQVADDVTLSSTVVPANGINFDVTLADTGQSLHTLGGSVTILAAGDHQTLPSSPNTVTSDGAGTGSTITLTDWAVVTGAGGSTQVAPGTLYDQAPVVTISGGGGAGATATATVAGGAVTVVTIDTAGSAFTSIPTISFTNAGRKFVERIKGHKVNATDGVQSTWDNTLGVTPPAGQSRIVAS